MKNNLKNKKIYDYGKDFVKALNQTGLYQEDVVSTPDEIKEIKAKVKTQSLLINIIITIVLFSFVSFVIDSIVFHIDNNKYSEKYFELDKQNIILENRINAEIIDKDEMSKKIDEQQVIITNLKKIQDCLKGKKYFQYEQCLN